MPKAKGRIQHKIVTNCILRKLAADPYTKVQFHKDVMTAVRTVNTSDAEKRLQEKIDDSTGFIIGLFYLY